MRTRAARLLAGATALLLVPAAVASADPPSNTVTTTFTAAGCAATFTVPAGVEELNVAAIGAPGGGSQGGKGAAFGADVDVSGARTLEVCVDQGGGAGGASDNGGDIAYSGDGADGGGCSSVGEPAATPFLVAAGGGGEGASEVAVPAAGGDAGLTGPGHDGNGAPAGSLGGTGAFNTVAGTGGAAGGLAGAAFQGGMGGAGISNGGGGGGGGGGLAGGGGGGAGFQVTPPEAGGAGGGGGSSWCTPPATCTMAALDTAGAGAQVIISYDKVATATTAGVPQTVVRPSTYALFSAKITKVFTRSPSTDLGTATFEIDGVPVASCTDVPVVNAHPSDATVTASRGGAASCGAIVPAVAGEHHVSVVFSGVDAFLASESSEVPFTVGEPGIGFSAPGLDFGSSLVGTTAAAQSVTVTNTGAESLRIGDPSGPMSALEHSLGHGVTLTGADAAAFAITADACSGEVLAPQETCDVTVTFTSTRSGAHAAALAFSDDAPGSPHAVTLAGAGDEPAAPQPPAPTPTAPPTTPVSPTPPTATTSTAKGATLAPQANGKAPVTTSGAVSLPLTCPAGDVCDVSGSLTLGASAKAATASAAAVRVLARFKDIKVKGGKVRTLKLKLPASFVRAARKAGQRSVFATLTIKTTLGSGAVLNGKQRVRLLIPRAAKRPSFTG